MTEHELDALALTGRSRAHVRDFNTADGHRFTAHPAAGAAFLRLREAARTAGIELAVASAFRDYAAQQAIWDAKWRGERTLYDAAGQPMDASTLSDSARVAAILEWSALPGASRHHWGSEFDIYDRAALPAGYTLQLLPAEFTDAGPFAHLAAWMDEHLARHGFFRPYDTERGGVHPEPWHISFAPVALPALRALQPAVLSEAVQAHTLCGQEAVLASLPHIHACHVSRVAQPPEQALAAEDTNAQTS